MKQLKWSEAKELIDNNQGIIFLEFSTSWCGDCKMMKPFVEQVENQFKDKNVTFIEVDAEEANTFRGNAEWEVLKVPSFFVLNKKQKNHIGYEFQPVAKLVEAINKELA